MPDYDIVELWDTIEHVVQNPGDVANGYLEVLDYCRAAHPHADWQGLANLDIAADLAHLESWFRSLLGTEPPQAGVERFWFMLGNYCKSDGRDTADMELIGGAFRDAEPDWFDDFPWQPENGLADSRVLDRIYSIAYSGNGGLGNDAEYPLCLTYAALAARHLATVSNRLLLLGAASRRVIQVGFHDGDYIFVGAATENGFKLSRNSQQLDI